MNLKQLQGLSQYVFALHGYLLRYSQRFVPSKVLFTVGDCANAR
ncbi:hypothetical protein CSB66_3538 [Enterobacter hormaechei]|nr:hypothetical protein CSB66_3538 [Enterobacter hormaechei]